MPCIFCQIAEQALPSDIVYEEDSVMAFLDLYPKSWGHTLVIPKVHAPDILVTDATVAARMWEIAQKMGTFLGRALEADGLNIYTAIGQEAGQEILHAHIHLIPRFDNSKYRHSKDTFFEIFQAKNKSLSSEIYNSKEERALLAKDLRRFSL